MKTSPNTIQNKRLLRFKDIVFEFGVTEWFWRSKVWAKDIPCVKLGNKILIDRKDIETFIDRNKKFA